MQTESAMEELILTIANKNYSSWSFRPWIALTAAGIPFREELIPFGSGRHESAVPRTLADRQGTSAASRSGACLGITGDH